MLYFTNKRVYIITFSYFLPRSLHLALSLLSLYFSFFCNFLRCISMYLFPLIGRNNWAISRSLRRNLSSASEVQDFLKVLVFPICFICFATAITGKQKVAEQRRGAEENEASYAGLYFLSETRSK